MSRFENAVKRRVAAGEVVEYFAKPVYSSSAAAPSSVVLSAEGSRAGFTPMLIPNPAAAADDH